MARGRKAREDDAGEVKVKDFAKAKKLYHHDIKPAKSKAGEFMQECSTAYKAVKKECHIQPTAMRHAIGAMEMEDAKRDDYFRCLVGLVNEMAGRTMLTFHSNDMVDMMEAGQGDAQPERRAPLATLMGIPSTGEETDLADVAEDIASEGDDKGEDPAPGTGAAAIAAMKKTAKQPAEATLN